MKCEHEDCETNQKCIKYNLNHKCRTCLKCERLRTLEDVLKLIKEITDDVDDMFTDELKQKIENLKK